MRDPRYQDTVAEPAPMPSIRVAVENERLKQSACKANACRQGRVECPVPDSCFLPESEPTGRRVPREESSANASIGTWATLAAIGAAGLALKYYGWWL